MVRHVGRKPQVIGVNGAAHDPLHLSGFGIDKAERIATRIGHNHRLFIWGEVEVVGLLAGGDLACDFPRLGVNDADAGVQGVEHKNWVGLRAHRNRPKPT